MQNLKKKNSGKKTGNAFLPIEKEGKPHALSEWKERVAEKLPSSSTG